MIQVEIWEYERGWGKKLDSVEEFETVELAQAFCDEYNKKNNLPIVPDWYMVAMIK